MMKEPLEYPQEASSTMEMEEEVVADISHVRHPKISVSMVEGVEVAEEFPEDAEELMEAVELMV